MQHEDPLANNGAIEDAGNSFRAFQAKLKQAMPESLRVRLPKVWAERFHAASQDDIASCQSVRKSKDVTLHLFTEVVDLVVHAAR